MGGRRDEVTGPGQDSGERKSTSSRRKLQAKDERSLVEGSVSLLR